MEKSKEQPRYNVVSIRLSDSEKALLEEASRRHRLTVPVLMREAIRLHIPSLTRKAGDGKTLP